MASPSLPQKIHRQRLSHPLQTVVFFYRADDHIHRCHKNREQHRDPCRAGDNAAKADETVNGAGKHHACVDAEYRCRAEMRTQNRRKRERICLRTRALLSVSDGLFQTVCLRRSDLFGFETFLHLHCPADGVHGILCVFVGTNGIGVFLCQHGAADNDLAPRCFFP